jgi:hypothetical protein
VHPPPHAFGVQQGQPALKTVPDGVAAIRHDLATLNGKVETLRKELRSRNDDAMNQRKSLEAPKPLRNKDLIQTMEQVSQVQLAILRLEDRSTQVEQKTNDVYIVVTDILARLRSPDTGDPPPTCHVSTDPALAENTNLRSCIDDLRRLLGTLALVVDTLQGRKLEDVEPLKVPAIPVQSRPPPRRSTRTKSKAGKNSAAGHEGVSKMSRRGGGKGTVRKLA